MAMSKNRPAHKRGSQSKVKPYKAPEQNRGMYLYGKPEWKQRAGAAKLPGSGK